MIEVNLKKMPIVVLNHYKTLKSFQLAISEEHSAAAGLSILFKLKNVIKLLKNSSLIMCNQDQGCVVHLWATN